MSMGQGNPTDMIKAWSPRDWMVVGGGVVAFIFSLFDFVNVTASYAGVHASVSGGSAWHSYAILGLLLIFASSIVWALQSLKVITLPPLPAKYQIISASASGLGALLVLVRALSYSTGVPGLSVGPGFGGIVTVIAGLVVTGGAVWSLQAGEQIGSVAPRGASVPPSTPPGGGYPTSGTGFGPPSAPPSPPPSSSPGQPPAG